MLSDAFLSDRTVLAFGEWFRLRARLALLRNWSSGLLAGSALRRGHLCNISSSCWLRGGFGLGRFALGAAQELFDFAAQRVFLVAWSLLRRTGDWDTFLGRCDRSLLRWEFGFLVAFGLLTTAHELASDPDHKDDDPEDRLNDIGG